MGDEPCRKPEQACLIFLCSKQKLEALRAMSQLNLIMDFKTSPQKNLKTVDFLCKSGTTTTTKYSLTLILILNRYL